MSPDASPAAAAPRVRVGTAGWMYKDWEGIVYPPPRRGFDRLALMADLFDANEINSTFYRVPPPSMTREWARRVSHNSAFLFSAKLYRAFTHDGKATDEDGKAVRAAMEPLAEAGRLGCVLVQLPMSFHAVRRTARRSKGSSSVFPPSRSSPSSGTSPGIRPTRSGSSRTPGSASRTSTSRG